MHELLICVTHELFFNNLWSINKCYFVLFQQQVYVRRMAYNKTDKVFNITFNCEFKKIINSLKLNSLKLFEDILVTSKCYNLYCTKLIELHWGIRKIELILISWRQPKNSSPSPAIAAPKLCLLPHEWAKFFTLL